MARALSKAVRKQQEQKKRPKNGTSTGGISAQRAQGEAIAQVYNILKAKKTENIS
jgi:hypothetical protein